MLKIILGLEPVDYISKKTGKQVVGVTLYLASENVNVYGQITSDLYIAKNSKLYDQLIDYVNEPLKLIGKSANVDYNAKGFLEDFSLVA